MPTKSLKTARLKRATRVRRTVPQARGEETRAKLLGAARDEFLRHGYHGASMRSIAAAAGLAVGGIYNHFASKDEVFAAVLDANHPYHVLLPALQRAAGEDLEAFLRDAAQRVFEALRGAETTLMPLVFIELVEFQGRHLQDLAARLLPTLMGFFQRFDEHGGQLRDLPVPVVMRAFMSLAIGYMLSELIVRDTPIMKHMQYDWTGGMIEIFVHGAIRAGSDGRQRGRRKARA
jgi:AcrR family transcriptional regulator